MTSAHATNGKAPTRKQLSDQLDRLDGIIDALAEGLNAAVADACREGARAAVREVLLELVNNADLMAAVRATAAPVTPAPVADAPSPAPAEPSSFWGRMRAGVSGAVNAVTTSVRTLVKSVEVAVQPATDALKRTGTTKTVIAVAVGVGLATGAVSLVCPAWMAAAFTGVTGAAAVVAGHVGASVNAIFARLRMVD